MFPGKPLITISESEPDRTVLPEALSGLYWLFEISAIDESTPLIEYEHEGTLTTDPEILALPSPSASAGLIDINEAPIPKIESAMRIELSCLLKRLLINMKAPTFRQELGLIKRVSGVACLNWQVP